MKQKSVEHNHQCSFIFGDDQPKRAGGTLEVLKKKEILTVKEVADYLRVSRVTVWRWCHEGKLPASRIGRNWRIRRDVVVRLLEEEHPPDFEANLSCQETGL